MGLGEFLSNLFLGQPKYPQHSEAITLAHKPKIGIYIAENAFRKWEANGVPTAENAAEWQQLAANSTEARRNAESASESIVTLSDNQKAIARAHERAYKAVLKSGYFQWKSITNCENARQKQASKYQDSVDYYEQKMGKLDSKMDSFRSKLRR